MAWANNWLRHHGALTYSLLQSQAMLIGPQLNITDFSYSDGWIWRFCNLHGLALRRRVGESSCANIGNVELARHAIPIVLALLNARPADVFNADETGIVFGAQPHKTLAPGRVSGVKRVADRITVMLCCNATGNERLKPLVIGKEVLPDSTRVTTCTTSPTLPLGAQGKSSTLGCWRCNSR